MHVRRISISNFRGIKSGLIDLPKHSVLVGDNNSCKSTILEALDLVLGPERISRPDPIDEHDFYAGDYVLEDGTPIEIQIEVTIIDLSEEQRRIFADHIEFWDLTTCKLLEEGQADQVDQDQVVHALRVTFVGHYDAEEDNFRARSLFSSSINEDGDGTNFTTRDKRACGFLYLRTLRTGSRALSLERGSLLDIILKIEEKRPQMWENVLLQLRQLAVAEEPELGISDVLSRLQESVRSLVTSDWADAPKLRLTDQTRETLRKQLVLFIETGATDIQGNRHIAPYFHQGTGTINALVLALLSIIASLKESVIFAMEEPEIAIPPHAQKRMVMSVRHASAQAIFTSHSPYVLEEFDAEQVIVLTRENGALAGIPATLPPTVKPKAYRHDMRRRTCEALLARRVLVVEGATELLAYPAAFRRLANLDSGTYSSLEALGVAVVDAETDTQIAPLGKYFKDLKKSVFATCDLQLPAALEAMRAECDSVYESPESGFEELILGHSDYDALRRYAEGVEAQGDWPTHLHAFRPSVSGDEATTKLALRQFFTWQKASGTIATFLESCTEGEMPNHIPTVAKALRTSIMPTVSVAQVVEEPVEKIDEEEIAEDDDEIGSAPVG